LHSSPSLPIAHLAGRVPGQQLPHPPVHLHHPLIQALSGPVVWRSRGVRVAQSIKLDAIDVISYIGSSTCSSSQPDHLAALAATQPATTATTTLAPPPPANAPRQCLYPLLLLLLPDALHNQLSQALLPARRRALAGYRGHEGGEGSFLLCCDVLVVACHAWGGGVGWGGVGWARLIGLGFVVRARFVV